LKKYLRDIISLARERGKREKKAVVAHGRYSSEVHMRGTKRGRTKRQSKTTVHRVSC